MDVQNHDFITEKSTRETQFHNIMHTTMKQDQFAGGTNNVNLES